MSSTGTAAATVLYEVAGGVATITLNRPDKLNAWTRQMGEEFVAAFARAGADGDVRAVVVTGAGRGFCAGADMSMLEQIGAGKEPVGRDHPMPIEPLKLGKPVVAAVNGACVGQGLAIAASADVRFAAAGAKFASVFSRRGLVAEYGTSWLLPRLVGFGNAMDILISGRTFAAEEAHAMGFVNRVTAPESLLAEATAYARELADRCAPGSMAVIKRQLYDHATLTFDDAFEASLLLMRDSLEGDDFREGVAAFLEGRPAKFKPLS